MLVVGVLIIQHDLIEKGDEHVMKEKDWLFFNKEASTSRFAPFYSNSFYTSLIAQIILWSMKCLTLWRLISTNKS